jgi:hypothetical protein
MSGKIDAVLPLTLRDFERSGILRESLQRFFVDLGTCWVVTRDHELAPISALIKGDSYRIIPESVVIPELQFYNTARRCFSRSHTPTSGWVVQQLVKLAIANFVDTEFYLTLDADVICIRRVCFGDLIKDGRALARRYHHEIHKEWYEAAARLLGLPRSAWVHDFTPALLSREATCRLTSHLSGRVNRFVQRLAVLLPPRSLARAILTGWRSYLLRNLPWTEYTLYNTFLEAMGLYDRYHVSDNGIRVCGRSVWQRDQFSSWDPEKSAEGGYFAVVQSNTDLSVSQVREKVRKCLEQS